MKSSDNQHLPPISPQIPVSTPLSLLFLKSIVAGMGIVLVLGFTLVVAMILLGMKYFTDVRSCDKHPTGDIFLKVPTGVTLSDIHVDCGIIKAKAQSDKTLYGFNSETGALEFTIHTQNRD